MPWASRGTRSEEIIAAIGAREWARRKAAVRARDKVCQWPMPSGRGVCGGPIDEIDHWVARDRHAIADLRGLCSRHHARKTAAEAAEGRARAAAARTRRRTK